MTKRTQYRFVITRMSDLTNALKGMAAAGTAAVTTVTFMYVKYIVMGCFKGLLVTTLI